MAFTIQLYNNNSEVSQVGKDLSATQSFSGTLKDQTSIDEPSILVNSTSVPQGDYARIEAFGRYYFIDDIVSVRNGLWELKMTSDVLNSFQSQIRSMTELVTRQELNYNNYIQDNQAPIASNVTQDVKKFSGTFSNQTFLLTINGAAIK